MLEQASEGMNVGFDTISVVLTAARGRVFLVLALPGLFPLLLLLLLLGRVARRRSVVLAPLELGEESPDVDGRTRAIIWQVGNGRYSPSTGVTMRAPVLICIRIQLPAGMCSVTLMHTLEMSGSHCPVKGYSYNLGLR